MQKLNWHECTPCEIPSFRLSIVVVFSRAEFHIRKSMEGSGEPLPSVMKAVRVHKFGGPDVLQLDTNVPLPTCGAKQVDATYMCRCTTVVSFYLLLTLLVWC